MKAISKPDFSRRVEKVMNLIIREFQAGCLECKGGLCQEHLEAVINMELYPRQCIDLKNLQYVPPVIR